MEDFKVGRLLGGSGIRKLRGAKPLAVFTAIFTLPFGGVNFFRGIVNNRTLGFQKDSVYEFLKNPRYNWRKFLLALVAVVVRFMDVLTSEQREKVLIIDDSTYDRSRSKVVELLAWVHDHNRNRSLKGFKLLTLGWSDGVSFLPLDFTLCSSAKANKRIQGIKKELDKRCCGYKRRMEAMVKSTKHLEPMVRQWSKYCVNQGWICTHRGGACKKSNPLGGSSYSSSSLIAFLAKENFSERVRSDIPEKPAYF